MTYEDFIVDYIDQRGCGEPIFTEDLTPLVADGFGIEEGKAQAAVSVAMKRILDNEKVPDLRRYQRGIFYRTRKTAYGEIRIKKRMLIDRKYIQPDKGYETGAGLFYRMGLTTHIPNMRFIATNAALAGTRYDKNLDITICQPKTEITADNKEYLRTLDVLCQMDSIPYDADHPYDIIGDFIDRSNLKYEKLLLYADKFYNQKTILRLGHVAGRKEA